MIGVLPVPHHLAVEPRALSGDIRILVSSILERRGFLAAFTERTGGTSAPPHASLNLGAQTGDTPGAVEENRSRVVAALGTGPLVAARQVHGTAVLHVAGAVPDPGTALGEADALVTSLRSVPLAVMTADCVPLALASEREGLFAVIHIGWRGLALGIVQRAVRLFADPGEVAAAIGPAIGPCHYEVGPEVVDEVRRGAGEIVSTTESADRARLDLAGTVERVIRSGGLTDVDRAGECTACEPLRFFSHRRDRETGRQALIAMRL